MIFFFRCSYDRFYSLGEGQHQAKSAATDSDFDAFGQCEVWQTGLIRYTYYIYIYVWGQRG